jgi:hypothetical protein
MRASLIQGDTDMLARPMALTLSIMLVMLVSVVDRILFLTVSYHLSLSPVSYHHSLSLLTTLLQQ